jgi:hypothetical protein
MSSLFIYAGYGTGTLIIEMVDPPKDWGAASHVYIHYSAIMIHRADAANESGWSTVSVAGWINLTSVLNVSKAISQGPLQAGKYNVIRFNVTEAIVTVNGANYTATVASGKLNIPITRGGIQVNAEVNAGGTTYLVIDVAPRVTGSEAEGFRLVPSAKAALG